MPKPTRGTLSPFELAAHHPARFAEIFGADADVYLERLGFDAAAIRLDLVEIVVRGKSQQARLQRAARRQQRFYRLTWEREAQAMKAQLELSRRRLRRLRLLCRWMIDRAGNRPTWRRRFARALRRRVVDRENLTVATMSELLQKRFSNDRE